ncbi:MAG: ferritin-like domain-containing protein [Acidimicrobiia bacterium]|nr:ferritin-like domain-containing protein [Acidimicrobiia bacterium]
MSTEFRSDSDILGRASLDDLDAIMDISNHDVDEVIHTVKDNADAIFTWDYEKGARPALNKLYEKAKGAQWNGETDLDWSIEVDPSQVLSALSGSNAAGPFAVLAEHPDSPFKHFGDKEWDELAVESLKWRMSQFMHGEQGALICTAKIVETVPWIDAKYYAATQVMDEARHVEVFAKYLDEKLPGTYPINAHLKMLLDDIIEDSRWDMTYLGMQIMVEGLALAAFGFMYQLTEEPLLKQLLRYVMSDEARHVAFGVLSLKEYYAELSDAEMRERQEFAFEAAVRMRDRFLQQEVWDRMGVDKRKVTELLLQVPKEEMIFQQLLFSKIVPNCKKLGLLDAADGWLRTRFEEIGVIEFEDWADTSDEYLAFDAVSADRAAAAGA